MPDGRKTNAPRSVSTRVRCSACGRALRPTHRFCPNCGTPVTGATTPASQAQAALIQQSGPSLQVSSDPSLDLSENRRLVTVMFADLSGSTTLGERLDPEDLRRVLASFFSSMSRDIRRYGGTVDKYIGDAVMAVFGAPVAHEDDAERAVNAALAMQASIGRLNDDLERQHDLRLSLRIGINTGEVVVGLLEGELEGAYTVVGDTVNTAQRFESSAPLGGVLVSEPTWRMSRLAFQFAPPIELTLKGKAEPQQAYRVLGRRDAELELPATPLVGRERELEQLQASMQQVIDGRGGTLHVVGEAGVGKSRLLREFRRGIDRSVRHFVSRCASFETETPYAVIASLLRVMFSIRPGADEPAARLAVGYGFQDVGESLDPLHTLLLLDILGYGERSGFDPQTKQRLLVSLLRRLLDGLAERTPIVVLLEDLHWIDSAGSAVLTELVRDSQSRRCLLLTTSRSGWSPSWPTESIELEALPEVSARQLVESVFGAPVDENLAETILARTGGNPFFVEEVVRGLWESDVLSEQDGRIVVQAGVTARVPATVQEVLISRLDRLPPSAKRVLRPAAVMGRVFWQRVIERVLPDAPVTESIATLEREAFVVPRPQGDESAYMFRHALIQEVAYQNQLQSQRRTTHSAIGEAIEILYVDRLEEFVNELAFHYRHSDNDPKALFWLVRAGDRAKALFANQEALALYAAALERAHDGDGPLQAGSILERIGDIQHLIGRYDDAIASFRSAANRSAVAGAVTAARLQRKVGTALRIKGVYPDASSAFDKALELLGDDSTIESANIRLQVGQLHWRTGEYGLAQAAISRAVDIATALGQDDVLAEGLKQLGNIPLHTGDPNDAVVYFRRSQALYERLEDIAGIAAVRMNLGAVYGRMGRWDECLAELQASLELHRRIGDLWHIAMIHNNIGELHREQGDGAKAIASYERAISIKKEIGDAGGLAVALTGLGMAQVEAGELDAGRTNLLEAEAQFTALGRSMYLPHIYRFLASAELAKGELEQARRYAERSIDFARAANARHQEAMTGRVMAEILLAGGDVFTARELLQTSRDILASVGEAGELARTEAVLQRLEAMPPTGSPPG